LISTVAAEAAKEEEELGIALAVASAKGIKSYSEAAAASAAKKQANAQQMYLMPTSIARERGLMADVRSSSRPRSAKVLVSKSLHALPAVRDRRGRPLMRASSKPNFSRAKRVTTSLSELTVDVDFVDSYAPNNVKRSLISYVH
jgi:hypothetical protein